MSSDLPQGYRRVAEGRIRENVGLGYGDFTIGMIIEHRPGRTVTETDNLLGTALTGNVAPIHTDAHYSSTTEWRQTLVCSGVTLNIVAGMTVRSTSGLTIANLGLDEVRFENPVFVGNTLYAETEIVDRRLSKSRPEHGIVTCQTSGFNEDGKRAVKFTRTFLVPTEPETVRAATNY
ncbi:MaoC family dehydratase [Streptomyces sp. A3M-1-3]|uniref:MaoC/PaaZ C-terminal domain-containing protein n=1 Tax=Streptomyces sp. A3M-1-3 TaxID=2962044 RepID=UPI0020B63B07|nr:MaoC/PaaZ C-terminal domain-containing protein [Streptomyces sp. A3M-1-3]MCP3817509.1 MaoC family dehydratase [Streptomyces sp. A3M-1-3]